MQRLQRLQPEMKAIQQKYKEDKQRQQQELMKFYKEHNVNPFSSCLPLALQIPVFISLFYMLRQDLRKNICPAIQATFQQHYQALHHVSTTVAATKTTACGAGHGASFLFIGDLTNAAHGLTLVVLILLYVGTQLGSTLLMSAPTMDKTQRQLMIAMPLFFVIFIISFPAGVIVYWITTNAWTILQGYIVRRRIGPMGPAPAAPAGGGGAPPTRAGGDRKPAATSAPVGDGSGGLAGILRGRSKVEEPAAVGSRPRERRSAPPPPPRKKKKRSGRRR
jgi:YidC/Oxa1 family membrane protein insertase